MTDPLVSNARLMPSGLTLMMDYPHFALVSSMITAFNFETYKAFCEFTSSDAKMVKTMCQAKPMYMYHLRACISHHGEICEL